MIADMDKPVCFTCEHCGQLTYLNPGKKDGFCCECGRRVFLPESVIDTSLQESVYDKSDSSVLTPDNSVSQDCKQSDSSDSARPILFVILGLIVVVIIISVVASLGSKKPTPVTVAVTEDTISPITYSQPDSSLAVAVVDETAKDITWTFTEQLDQMTDSKNVWASLSSDNFEYFHFPYEGGSYLKLTVRYMKKYGNDVLIQISRGQFNANEYRGTDYITARFDDGTPQKYYVDEPSDGSSDCLFVRKKADFIKRCKSAKKILIDVPIYQGGRPTFTFTVDKPLEWNH